MTQKIARILVFTLDFLREFWVNVSMAVDNAAAEFSEPITAHDILSKLKPSFSSTLISENSPIQPTEIAFFKALVESNPEITDLNHWCRSCLEKLSKDQWQKDFSGSYGFTELVLALSKKGLAISLYTAFEDALLELGQRIAANGNV